MDLRVRKESEDYVETLALLALLVLLVKEDLLGTEDSLVQMGCQDLRVLKEIVEYQAHQDRKVLWETWAAQENLVYQVQGDLLAPLESKVQRASQDHWVPRVKMVAQVLQGPLETEGLQEPWEYQAPRASVVTQERQVNRDLQECQVKEVLQEKMEKLGLQDPLVHLVLQETEESRVLQV